MGSGTNIPDAETVRLATLVVQKLRVAVHNSRMYPPGSQPLETALSALMDPLTRYLEPHNSLTLSHTGNKLLVNTTEIKDSAVSILIDQNLDSITFKSGYTREELAAFIALLSRKRGAAASANLEKTVEELGISHIALNQTKFVAVGKDETVVSRIGSTLERLGTGSNLSVTLQAVRETYDLMDQLPDEADREGVKQGLARRIATMNPEVIRDIFDQELPKKIEESGLRQTILAELSKEKIQEIFSEITHWYHALKQRGLSDQEALDKLNQVKKFLRTILEAPAARQIPAAAYEELLHVGALDEPPPWVADEIRAREESPQYLVERFLEEPAEDLLDEGRKPVILQAVKRLCQAGLEEYAGRLADRIAENLSHPSNGVRLAALGLLEELHAIFTSQQNKEEAERLEEVFFSLAEVEKNPAVLVPLYSLLRRQAMGDFLTDNVAGGLATVSLLRKRLAVGGDPHVVEAARRELDQMASGVGDLVAADLRSPDSRRHAQAYQLVARLEGAAVDPLIRRIKETEDLRTRRGIARVLGALGPEAVSRMLDSLGAGLSSETAHRIVQILDEFSPTEVIPRLQRFLPYATAVNKTDIIHLLGRIHVPEGEPILLALLNEPDTAIRHEVIRLLGEHHILEANAALLDLLPKEKPETQEVLCLALGQMKSPRAVPALTALIKGRRRWFTRVPAAPHQVRVRAVWALKQIGTPEAISALRAAQGDKSPAVQAALREPSAPSSG